MATLMKCGSMIQVILYYAKKIKMFISYFHIRACEIHASPNLVSPSTGLYISQVLYIEAGFVSVRLSYM